MSRDFYFCTQFYIWIILFILLTSGCAIFEEKTIDNASLSALKVVGNEVITKENGHPIRFRGVSLCSLAWHSPLEQIKEVTDVNNGWHANILRLPVQAREWDRGSHQSYIRNRLEPAIKLCIAKNVYCIIDWHLIAAWDSAETDEKVREFWKMVAPLYADNSNIIYEIFNEPTTPKARTRENWLKWRERAQTWVDYIRSLAPETILLVGSPHWDQMTSFADELPFKGENIAYVTHVYPQWKPESWDQLFGKAADSVPMMITEWGWSSAKQSKDTLLYGTRESFGQPLRNYLDARPHIGWTAWSYDPRCGPSMLGVDADMGDFVKQWLREVNQANQ